MVESPGIAGARCGSRAAPARRDRRRWRFRQDGRLRDARFRGRRIVVPGKYIVTVTKYEKRSVEAVSDVDSSDYNPEEEATATKPPKNELPSKYESIKNSDLNVEIKSGEDNVIPLELKD
jgi:hypothetical protein